MLETRCIVFLPLRGKGLLLSLTLSCAAGLAIIKIRRHRVVGDSMAPTLRDGDRIIVTRSRRIGHGDVVVLEDPRLGGLPGRIMVKRLVSIEGEMAWVEGDNREFSTDSRTFGAIPVRSIRGRAIYRYSPSHSAGRLRSHRI